MPDVCLHTRKTALATPTSAWRAVCATSSSSWNSFQYNPLTAARNSTCQIGMPHCWRDRAIVASLSAASLRGAPQCDGENIKSAGRTRFTKESSIAQISSATQSRTASGAARSASVADRESVDTGICVGDWDVSGRGGMRCLKPSFSDKALCSL
ncbi:hypothetical protein TCDM_12080 [Trypanosoma cruzi Dm28c]|uniref:Uncharacterized protein n=1 Tax=Trypanosoma cruzi Dm28c TaxID=1416333 RepID=V5AIE5_TRYCR|nr:hypothetical protein TCDM_12080 [Trypanosoma cruzi Dm28c]